MFYFALVIGITAFLGGAATATLVMISIGVRNADRPQCHLGYPGSPVDSFTRATLRTGTWPHASVAFRGSEED